MKTSTFFRMALLVASQSCVAMACSHQIPFDIVFTVDTIQSTGAENYHHFFDLIANGVPSFNVGENATRVGLVVLDTPRQTTVPLSGNLDKLHETLRNIRYRSNMPQTMMSLSMSKLLFSSTRAVTNIIALITDGTDKSKPQSAINYAQLLKNSGIKILTVGVLPLANEVELKNIASKPDHNLMVAKYEALADIVDRFFGLICEAANTK